MLEIKKNLIVSLPLVILLTLSAIRASAGEDYEKRAQKHLDLMNYNQAARDLERAIEKKPHKEGLRVKLAFACYRQGEADEAIQVLHEEKDIFPENLEASILLGYILYESDKFKESVDNSRDFIDTLDEAVKALAKKKGLDLLNFRDRVEFNNNYEYFVEKVQKTNMNFGLPNFICGLEHKKKIEEAEQNFQTALRRKYSPLQCHIQIIDIAASTGDWRAALNRAEDSIRTLGRRAEILSLKGFLHNKIGEPEAAALCYEQALDLKPYCVETQKNLARLYCHLSRFEDAQGLLRKTLKIVPLDYEARFMLEDAIKKRTTLINNGPSLTKSFADKPKLRFIYEFKTDFDDLIRTINQYSMNHLQWGLVDESVGILRSFLELNDLSPEINYNLGQIYNSRNDLGNALRYAWRAMELKKDFRDAIDLCGSVFFKLEDFEKCIRLYKQSVDIDPKDAMAHFNLGCAYSAAGDFERAEVHWKNAIYYEEKVKITKETEEKKGNGLQIAVTVMKRPVSFSAHKALGQLYLNLKLKSQALREFLDAIELEPSDSEPYYEVGMILSEKDEKEKAVEYFERYLYLGGKKEDEVKAILIKIK